ncbi:MAG TPA: hypothetical protein VIK91_11615 [Nannocystis sp.]|jgi:hypothetical protein
MGIVRQIEALAASPSGRVWLRRAGTGLLLLWIAMGGAHTAIVMARSQGVRAARPAGAERTIGLTDPVTGPAVTALAEALERLGGDPTAPALVRLPAGTEASLQDYFRFQLNHVVYPRPVDVVAGTDAPRLPLEAYAGVVVAPGAEAVGVGPVLGEHRGYVIHAGGRP